MFIFIRRISLVRVRCQWITSPRNKWGGYSTHFNLLELPLHLLRSNLLCWAPFISHTHPVATDNTWTFQLHIKRFLTRKSLTFSDQFYLSRLFRIRKISFSFLQLKYCLNFSSNVNQWNNSHSVTPIGGILSVSQ